MWAEIKMYKIFPILEAICPVSLKNLGSFFTDLKQKSEIDVFAHKWYTFWVSKSRPQKAPLRHLTNTVWKFRPITAGMGRRCTQHCCVQRCVQQSAVFHTALTQRCVHSTFYVSFSLFRPCHWSHQVAFWYLYQRLPRQFI